MNPHQHGESIFNLGHAIMNFQQAVNLINELTNTFDSNAYFVANQEQILKAVQSNATPSVKPLIADMLTNDFNYPDANYVASMIDGHADHWAECFGKRAIISFAKQLAAAISDVKKKATEEQEKEPTLVKCSDAQKAPSEIIFSAGVVVVTKSLIQCCNEYAAVKYFIDNSETGSSYGSTCSRVKACAVAIEMNKLLKCEI